MVAGLCSVAGFLLATPVADVASTPHNLSVSGSGDVKAVSADQVCVFCHTPHGATNYPGAPLWNRALNETTTYTVYTSESLDAETIAGQLDQPQGSSKLCLSCHDGTLAIDTVNVSGGVANVTIPMTGLGAGGTMPTDTGMDSGFTRLLGTDLRNDHPISFIYDSTLAAADGELVDPAVSPHIDVGVPGLRPIIPLEATGQGGEPQIQCGTCHDPHLTDAIPGENNKFLRLNRFQTAPPAQGLFNTSSDTLCLACHDKEGWSDSAHANQAVADEQYILAHADVREFPATIQVWQAACLNCHDTHTVHGARRLLREGTDSLVSPKLGGNSAIEETCYQCHNSAPIITPSTEVPDIESEFSLAIRMPIDLIDQQAATEQHEIVDADLTETQTALGKGQLTNRHVECTDCHNPHRLMRNSLFNGTGSSTQRTHTHTAGTQHSNLASGALRGSWGVEPNYGSSAFLSLPSFYEVKKGDPGLAGSTSVTAPHVTREYQVCLKCHSDYGYDDNNIYPIGSRPDLNDSGGGTLSGTNNLEQYTNQAMEFQAPLGDQGEPGGNHRSWHPVIDITDRSASDRGQMSSSAFVPPWNTGIGSQTMYCSDCHGGNSAADTVVPLGNRPWGPHGSENNFLLKGSWSSSTGNNSDRTDTATDPNNGLCFKCHDWETYVDRDGADNTSGFSGSKDENLHGFHADRIGSIRCSWCHAAVPHGWKNKALLVNLNDVGPEAGLAAGTEISITSSGQTYNQGPYYNNSKLKVITWAQSGSWEDSNCGSASGQNGTGRDWMNNVCSNPP